MARQARPVFILFKTKMSAVKARRIMLEQERNKPKEETVIQKKTVSEVYKEYCENGRAEKAYSTIKKQDSLWNNHIQERFGDRYIDDQRSKEYYLGLINTINSLENINIDLDSKLVSVETNLKKEAVFKLIKKAKYKVREK